MILISIRRTLERSIRNILFRNNRRLSSINREAGAGGRIRLNYGRSLEGLEGLEGQVSGFNLHTIYSNIAIFSHVILTLFSTQTTIFTLSTENPLNRPIIPNSHGCRTRELPPHTFIYHWICFIHVIADLF